jgi:hypothetical protein
METLLTELRNSTAGRGVIAKPAGEPVVLAPLGRDPPIIGQS